MKTYFLPETGTDFKANLHCHTTVSDGRLTPEQIKEAYTKKGYAIVAYTDHNRLVDHRDLNDDAFLALNGYEVDISDQNSPRTCHLCLVAKTPDTPELTFDRAYTPEKINTVIRQACEGGFYVTYNHPTWSLESWPEYARYEGMDAMEIWNTGCERVGFDEYNSHAYDDLLRQNKRIACLATDDNHNGEPFDTPDCDSFGGWIVLRAPRLDYPSIIHALENKQFYASCGPSIEELWADGDQLHVRTSPAHRIQYITAGRRRDVAAAAYGDTVTEAVFRIRPDDTYFRVDVYDDYGRHANSNAVWTDMLSL